MRFLTFRTVLNLYIIVIVVRGLCLNETNCPAHKPYCTSVGCVFECPEESFTDGMSCVDDCGTRFIYSRNCTSACPESHPLVIEETKLRGNIFSRLKYCVERCPSNTFIYQGICEHACPLDAQYSLNGTCTHHCPDTHKFERNMTKGARTIGKECLANCSGNFPVLRWANICIEICSPPLVQFNNTCIDSCPLEANLTMNLFSSKGITQHCVDVCPQSWYLHNNTCARSCPLDRYVYKEYICVSCCPADAPFVLDNLTRACVPDCGHRYSDNSICVDICPTYVLENKTCIDHCPGDNPMRCDAGDIRCEIENQTYAPSNRVTLCLEKCPRSMFVYYSACVNVCPAFTLENGSCVASCPNSAPFMCEHDHTWEYRRTFAKFRIWLCTEKCPTDMFLHNGTACLYLCPDDMKIFKTTCVMDCPEEAPFMTGNHCLEKCANDSYADGFDCVKTCPVDKHYFDRNMTCLENCPSAAPLVHTVYSDSWYMYFKPPSKRICLETCPGDTYVFNNTCVYPCPEGFRNYRNECLETCPSESPFIFDSMKYINYQSICRWIRGVWTCPSPDCLKECPDNFLVDDYICVEQCQNNKYLFKENRTCLDQCPDTNPLYVIGWGPPHCHVQCPEAAFYDEGRCVRECNLKVKFRNLCLLECPSAFPFIIYGYCVSTCPNEWYAKNYRCEETCDLLISDKLCVKECPSDRPFLVQNILGDPKFCKATCYPYISFNRVCISTSNCTTGIIFQDQCLEHCPERSIWIARTTENVVEKHGIPVCHSKNVILTFIISSATLSFASAMVILWCLFPAVIALMSTSQKLPAEVADDLLEDENNVEIDEASTGGGPEKLAETYDGSKKDNSNDLDGNAIKGDYDKEETCRLEIVISDEPWSYANPVFSEADE